MELNTIKRGETEPNGAKQDQTVPKGPNGIKFAQTDIRLYEVKIVKLV